MSPSETSNWTTPEASARSVVYRLLARLWLRELDGPSLRVLRSPPLCDAFAEAGGRLPGDDDAAIEALAIDYCQLFIGPANHLPPFQSVWQSGQFESDAIASVKGHAEVVGYDIATLPSGVMLDHLGVQLDVMGHILARIATWQPDSGRLDDVSEVARSFFAKHLTWPSRLLAIAAQKATTEFYRSTIALTGEFLDKERPSLTHES